jgi:hypothetical protein
MTNEAKISASVECCSQMLTLVILTLICAIALALAWF